MNLYSIKIESWEKFNTMVNNALPQCPGIIIDIIICLTSITCPWHPDYQLSGCKPAGISRIPRIWSRYVKCSYRPYRWNNNTEYQDMTSLSFKNISFWKALEACEQTIRLPENGQPAEPTKFITVASVVGSFSLLLPKESEHVAAIWIAHLTPLTLRWCAPILPWNPAKYKIPCLLYQSPNLCNKLVRNISFLQQCTRSRKCYSWQQPFLPLYLRLCAEVQSVEYSNRWQRSCTEQLSW